MLHLQPITQDKIRFKIKQTFFLLIVCLAISACSNHADDKSQTDKFVRDSSSKVFQQTDNTTTDSIAEKKEVLTKIYSQAIAEFIKAAYKKDKTNFDTLFFGKHVYGQPDDFPDIDLPETIENTHVRLIAPEAGLKKQQERKSLVYINMMGWVDKEKADFILVVFTNGGEHQFDYYINFNFNTSRNEFELKTIQFENYLHDKENKPGRTTIYEDGKYVDDK